MKTPSRPLPRHASRTILAAWAGLLLLPVSIAGAQGTPPGLEVGWYRDYTAPESKETFEEIARFFDRHLGRQDA